MLYQEHQFGFDVRAKEGRDNPPVVVQNMPGAGSLDAADFEVDLVAGQEMQKTLQHLELPPAQAELANSIPK